MAYNDCTPGQDMIDLRDVLEARRDLFARAVDSKAPSLTSDEIRLYAAIVALVVGELGGDLESAAYMEPTLVHDCHFTRYARTLAVDLEAIDNPGFWPVCHINWDAAAASLREEYTEVTYGGHTYWRGTL